VSSIKPKFFYLLAVSFLYSAAPLIIFPYISRVLGPANIGRINFIDYASQFFILFASFGIPYYGVREIARARNNKALLSRVTSELVLLHAYITVISLVLFSGLVFFQHNEFSERGLIVLALINIASSAFGLEWMIHGLEDFSFLARRSFLVKILSLVAIFIFVRQHTDYVLYYFILIAGNLAVLLTDLGYVLRKKITLEKNLQLKRHLRPLFLFFLTTVTLSIYTFFDTVILGLIAGSVAVGFYTTSLKIIRLAHNLISDLGGVLLPRISFLIESGENEEIERIMNKSLQYVLTITIPLGLFFYLAAPEIILVLGGKQFYGSIPVLQLLSVLPLIIGLTNIFFMQILLPFGKERIMLTGVLIGCVVSITSNLLLCPVFAEKGAAISCLAAEAVVCIFLGIAASRQVRLIIPSKLLGGIVLSGLFFIPVVSLVRHQFNNALMGLLVSGLLCLLLFMGLQLYLFQNRIIGEVVAFLGRKALKKE
jgi:O-antigen/teichoic acid export membrane protein